MMALRETGLLGIAEGAALVAVTFVWVFVAEAAALLGPLRLADVFRSSRR